MNWIGRFLVKILDGITEESVTKVQIRKNQLLHQEVPPEENLQEHKKKLKRRHLRNSKIFKPNSVITYWESDYVIFIHLFSTSRRSREAKKKTSEETPKKTRSGRTVKIPQVDGFDGSSNSSSSSDESSEVSEILLRKIPQFDGPTGGPMPGHSGQGGGQQQQQQPTGTAYGNNQPTQINQSSSFYIGDQNQTFSGVIPILMPPGRNPFHIIIIIITNTITKHLQSVSLDKRLVLISRSERIACLAKRAVQLRFIEGSFSSEP